VATRAGARQVEYAAYGQPGMQFSTPALTETVRTVFSDSLALRTAGLADTPAQIAAGSEIVLGYGSPASPWTSPFLAGRPHPHPTVAARAHVPIRVWMFDLTVSIVSETEVK
jgi:hypothetical protein